MILLWGSSVDGPLSAVRGALRARAAPVLFADQADAEGLEVTCRADGVPGGWIATGRGGGDLNAVRAAYVRPLDWRTAPSEGAGSRVRERSGSVRGQDALWDWADLTEVPVVNRPEAMGACFSKAHQLPVLASAGFSVPDTLATTDPDAAEAFWSAHGSVIYKSIGTTRSIVSRLTPSHRERLPDLVSCPVQLQELIPGTDHRVHVVGDRVFCSTVRSDADDYRYAASRGAAVEIQPTSLPENCADRCRALAERFGLWVAGIDLRLTPAGEWFCFEINPSPAFTFYDSGSDVGSIASAIADLLLGRPRRG